MNQKQEYESSLYNYFEDIMTEQSEEQKIEKLRASLKSVKDQIWHCELSWGETYELKLCRARYGEIRRELREFGLNEL